MNMRIEKKKIIVFIIVILVVFFGGWRMWPYSFTEVISTEKDSISSLACNATISGVNDDGKPFIDSYALQTLSEEDEHFHAIIDILNSTEYRQDFRNLLPWAVTSVDSGGNYDGRSVNVLFTWENTENENCYLSFQSNSIIVVGFDDDGLQIYHPIKRDVLNKLMDYIQAHGTIN